MLIRFSIYVLYFLCMNTIDIHCKSMKLYYNFKMFKLFYFTVIWGFYYGFYWSLVSRLINNLLMTTKMRYIKKRQSRMTFTSYVYFARLSSFL